MHFDDLSQITTSYAHVYLSPHLDDAVLSCGGAIAKHGVAGERVLVVTICTAAPRAEASFSELAREFHREWRLSPGEVVAARVREDRAAMDTLNADSLLVGCLDAIYRQPKAYHSRATLFNTPAPGDPLLPELQAYIARLRAQQPNATFYAPLGVGHHVDHLLAYQAALDSVHGLFALYEDFPYVARPGALEQRLQVVGIPLHSRIVAINQTLPQKIRGIRAYASQLAELAHSQLGQQANGGEAAERIAASVTDYARQVGAANNVFGERLWLPG